MNIQSNVSTLSEQSVLALMADGRERTVGDVMARIDGSAKEVRRMLIALSRKGQLQSSQIGSGEEYMMAWRLGWTEEEYGAAWRAMAWKEKHRPGLPKLLPPDVGRSPHVKGINRERCATMADILRERGPMTRDELITETGLLPWQVTDALQRARHDFGIVITRQPGQTPVYSVEAAE